MSKMCCKKCTGMCGWSLLVLGILYLLTDLGYVTFWNVQWWTALFLLAGVSALAMNKCPDCQALVKGKKK